MMLRAVARAVLGMALILAGCFEVRSLDRVFDEPAAGGAGGAVSPLDAGGAGAGDTGGETPDEGAADLLPPPDSAPEGDVGGCDGPDDTCDGKDDDCDGRFDEGFRPEAGCGVGQCADTSTPGSCDDGFESFCQPGAPTDEACDGLDNDCDERVDEGLTRPCETACGEGTEVCEGGAWVDCEGPGGVAEACNGLDDDCDGRTDEILPEPCPPDLNCEGGLRSCVEGEWGPCSRAVPEVCDGADQDCDGIVDEGDGPCGVCGQPVQWTCYEFVGPCQAGEPEERCVWPVAAVDGRAGEGIGRRIVAAGDLNGDNIDDFAAVGDVGAVAFSGIDGQVIFRVGEGRASGGDVAVVPTQILRPLVLTSVVDDGEFGQLNAFDNGNRVGDLRGGEGFFVGRVMAGTLGAVVLGDPDADEGRGAARLFGVSRLGVDPDAQPLRLDNGPRAGSVLAIGEHESGDPVLAYTSGAEDAQRVMVIVDYENGGQAVEVVPAGAGVGARLAVGPVVSGRPPVVIALDADDARLDLVRLNGESPIRMPLGRNATDVALVPAEREPTPPRVVVGRAGSVQILQFTASERVGVIELVGSVEEEWGSAVAGAADGVGDTQLIAIGAPGARDGAGRIFIYRVE